MTTIGVVGGSGLYEIEGLSGVRHITLDTPFGPTSDALVTGELDGTQLVFLPRHGRGHRLLPSEVPYRANLFAMKSLGVTWLISVSAVGSLKEEYAPGHMVLPDQYVDRTRSRAPTFFGSGIVAHVALADPVCPHLTKLLAASIQSQEISCHKGGTYVCIEGPTFSTRAESNLFRAAGLDIIGMTALPEARLAREAELHYATVGLVTDYDCWRTSESDVDIKDILAVIKQNGVNIRRVLTDVLPRISAFAGQQDKPGCACPTALANAIISDLHALPEERRELLTPLVGKYLP